MSREETLPAPPDVTLSPKVQAILNDISSAPLRQQVEGVARYALGALSDLTRVHLPQDSFEEAVGGNGAPGKKGDKHPELAPYVHAALTSTNHLLAYLMQTFPPPAAGAEAASDDDFDMEFDLVDGPTGDGGLSSKPPTPATQAMSPEEKVADAAHAFGSMLRSRIVNFGERLRHAVAQEDTWPLLAELDDNKHRLVKAVQGLLFGVLGTFGASARREEILPEYRSAVSESVQLRSALSDLSYHVGRFNTAISKAGGDMLPLVVALSDRLARFSARPEYRTLRAEDKKAVIDFRTALYSLRHSSKGNIPLGPLRLAVEGFSKFLESMSAINHREVLVLHDRQRLLEAEDWLEKAQDLNDDRAAAEQLDRVVTHLAAVQGRNPDIDDARRAYIPVDAQDVSAELVRWSALVTAALAPLGV